MKTEVLNCCNFSVSIYEKGKIDCFKSKKFFKKLTADKREIKKELVLVYYCYHCNHYILKFLWYTKKSANFFDYDDFKIFRGKEADKIIKEKIQDYKFYPLPKKKENKFNCLKQSKTMPWIYYKSLSDNIQIPRYTDESDNAGLKVYSQIRKVKKNV